MKRFTKISVVLIIAMFVMSMFLACQPTDGGDGGSGDGGDGGSGNGGDTGDTGTTLLEDNFESGVLNTSYNVTDNVKGGQTDFSWGIREYKGNKLLAVDVEKATSKFNNDSRLELTPLDLSSYTAVTLSFDFWLSRRWSMNAEVNGNTVNGGPNVHEGGYDMRIWVREGTEDWTEENCEVCHEDTFTDFDGSHDDSYDILMSQSVDLSAYAGKKDITVAFWVIGQDAAATLIDNLKIKGK